MNITIFLFNKLIIEETKKNFCLCKTEEKINNNTYYKEMSNRPSNCSG